MKKLFYSYLFCSYFSLIFISCSVKTPDAKIEHENWLKSLNDSIAYYKEKIKEDSVRLTQLNKETLTIIENFDYVNNPREVEGYYIMKGWKDKYPLKTTGLIARISENEQIEIIAALSGKSFNQIRIKALDKSFLSEIVKHDQALNYQTDKLTIVCFLGQNADSIGEFINKHEKDKISIDFIGGKKSVDYSLSENQKEMISETWNLFYMKNSARKIENEMRLLSRRIDICRQMLEKEESK